MEALRKLIQRVIANNSCESWRWLGQIGTSGGHEGHWIDLPVAYYPGIHRSQGCVGPELDRGRVSSNKKWILPPFCFSGRWHTFGALFTCLKEIKCGHDSSENLQCAKHIAVLFKRDESENSWWKWGHYTFRKWFRTIFQLRMLWNKLSIQPRGCQMVSSSGFDRSNPQKWFEREKREREREIITL